MLSTSETFLFITILARYDCIPFIYGEIEAQRGESVCPSLHNESHNVQWCETWKVCYIKTGIKCISQLGKKKKKALRIVILHSQNHEGLTQMSLPNSKILTLGG